MNDITARADALGNPASTPSDALEAARRILKQPAHYDDDELLMDARIVAEVFLAASPSPWRDMESAPKDGTRILADCGAVYRKPYAVRVLLWYDALQWEGEYGPDSGWILDLPDETIDAEFVERDPTHWMPLPEPPSEGEK